MLDTPAHSGAHALRLQGGGGQFAGLAIALPGEQPTYVSCFLRAAELGNVGYLALGGATLDESAVFFHLKPDGGGTAGLLSSDGGWHAGPFQPASWPAETAARPALGQRPTRLLGTVRGPTPRRHTP